MSDTRKGTCDVCRRSRKLTRFERWYWRCTECFPLTGDALKQAIKEGKERVALRTAKARMAYPIIGGPLAGEHAVTTDFYRSSGQPGDTWYREGGMYAHLADEYYEFNAASGSGHKRIGGSPTMIFVHRDLLAPLRSPRDR